MNDFPARILDDPHLAWVYLRRVVEASHPIIPQLFDAELSVSDLAHSIKEGDSRLPKSLLDATRARCEQDPRPDAEKAAQLGWRLITRDSDEWPQSFEQSFATLELNLQHVNSNIRGLRYAPFAVWAKGTGNLGKLATAAVTMVGTRGVSRYGEQVAMQWSQDFATQGYTLISGGAEGVDTAVHREALQQGGATMVVMAGSMDRMYPAQNKKLFERIAASGGVLLSEYPPGTAPARHRFLTRNRLAASLGRATVVVEAALRSGALNTLNWANAMGKATFAVPGPVTSAASQGCLKAIQEQRATLARVPMDVSAALGAQQLEIPMEQAEGPQLGWEETAVFDAAALNESDEHEGTAEAIQKDTGLPMPMVIRHLRTLSSKGLVKRVGKKWLKV